jgi:hypothetical protein
MFPGMQFMKNKIEPMKKGAMQDHNTSWRRVAGAFGLLFAAAPLAIGQTLIKNPSFENSMVETWPFYGAIDDWQVSGQTGVNEAGGPFHNNGTPIPDGKRVGFHQGSGTIAQDITGLTPGKRYWLQFRYDSRQGSDLDIAVKFSTVAQGGAMDETLVTLLKVKPAIATGTPYYSRTVPFTPDAEGGTITFDVATRGDSTALFDAVTLVQRDEGQFAVMNSSFEASGTVFNGAPMVGTDLPAISGWAKTGVAGVDDGTGGQADNGKIPEQALVGFISDAGSLAQTLEPLVSGENYQLSFAYNAKSGTKPHLQLLVDGAVLWEKDVNPVGGTQPYASQTVSFKAASATAQIMFSNTVAGATVLLDEIEVLGKTGSSLPPMVMEPAKAAIRMGDEATCTISVPAERLAQGPAVIKVRSANTGIFTLPDADATGVQSLNFQGTTTSQSFKIRGIGVGNAAVEITDPAGTPFPADITTVFVAATTFVLNPSFEVDKDSGVATAPVAGWTTSGANIGMAGNGNPFLSADDLTTPDRRQVLRIQGGGGTVSQMIKGLTPGQLYGLQFFYNGRTTGYPYKLALQVNFAGKQLANIQDIAPANLSGLTDYYFTELRFTPTAADGLLEFKTVVTEGDATLFLDAVSIVPRQANEIAVKNSSFEASPMGANWPGYLQPDRVAGWICTGGYGVNGYSPKTFFVEPFFDNGINSDQDNVFFGQGGVVMKQTLTGLTAGQPHTLVFEYNFRDGRGQNTSTDPNLGQVEVTVDGNMLLTTEDKPPVDTLSPWPGFRHTKPLYQAYVPITPAADTAELQIAHVGINGDETFMIEGVRLFPGTRTPPSITKELADQTVPSGAAVTFTVTTKESGLSFRWFQDGVPLKDGGAISGATTSTLKITNAQTANSGAYSVLASDGVGVVGSAAVLTVEAPSTISLGVSRASDGAVRVTWPTSATGYRLQSSTSVAGPFADDSTVTVVEGDQNVAVIQPQGAAKFFRLIQ